MSFVPWSTVLSIFDDLEDKLFAFDRLFTGDVVNDFAPIKTCKSWGRSNPFITPEIKSLMKLDYWRALARKTDRRSVLAWSAYKNSSKKLSGK